MTIKIWSYCLALCLTLAFIAGSARVVLPRIGAPERVGALTVTGKVKVNGQPAATGDIVSNGSTVETAKGSSAVVSLGKLGRVEVLAETRLKLNYGAADVSVLLDAGRVRMTNANNVTSSLEGRCL